MKKLFEKILYPILIITFILFLILITVKNFESIKGFYESFSLWLFPENYDRNGELFKITLSILGALGILFGLYVSLRRAKAIEEGVRIQSKAINIQSNQIELSRKAQIDERFKNAVEHLGNDKEPIILGGIAELHQLAKENRSNYSEIVFNILTSYIRSNSKLKNNRTIIQTIINCLFTNIQNNPYLEYTADLSRTNLIGINLNNKNLKNSDLSYSKISILTNSDISNSNLNNTIFFFPNIENIDFSTTKIYNTLFFGGKIEKCKFNMEKKYSTASFVNTNLNEIVFINCSISDWNFIATNIESTLFSVCEIISSKFLLSNLKNVEFSRIELFGKNDFRASNFEYVSFKNTTIMTSNFSGCRNNKPFNIARRKEIDELLDFKTDLSGINSIESNMYQCLKEELEKNDIDEILNRYDYYEKIVFPNK